MANALSVKLGIMTQDQSNRVTKLLETYNIPTTYNIKDVEDFYNHFFLDKKALDTKLKFILAVGLGDCKITSDITKDDLIEVLKEF